MINNWYRNMNPGVTPHPVGCICWECAADRRNTARTGQAVTAQARREAEGRKQVTLDLAVYGANPYRSSLESGYLDEPGDCTCRAEGRPYWPMHATDCPMRVRLCLEQDRKHVPASGKQVKGPKHDVTPALTPEQEIQKELAAFDNWMRAGWDLPGWMERGAPEPGKCAQCHLGWAVKGSMLCVYCGALASLEPEHREPAGSTNRDRALNAVFVLSLLASAVTLVLILGTLAWG